MPVRRSTQKPLAAIVRSSDGVRVRRADGTYHADEDQLEEIEGYAAELGRVYVLLEPEADVSGGLPIDKRPALRTAIAGVEAGEYTGIIVAYLSRLTRSRSGLEIWDRVEAAGGRIYVAQERTSTSTARGRHQRDIELAAAVYERERQAEGFDKRRRKTVEAGVWRTRTPPRGYTFRGPAGPDGKFRGQARRLVPNGQAEEIRQAARDLVAGTPLIQLAERLGMTTSGTRHVLKNRAYLGELHDGLYVNLTAHEAILSVDLFDAVQAALRDNPRPSRRTSAPPLLAGIATCATCERKMTRHVTRKLIYACARVHSGHVCARPAAITTTLLDAHVEALALERYLTVHVHGHAPHDVAAVEAAVADATTARAALMRAILAAGVADADAVDELREANERVRAAEDQLQEARARSLAPVAIPGDQAYQRLSAAGRNAALRGLIDRVLVRPAGRGRRVAVADRVAVVWRDD